MVRNRFARGVPVLAMLALFGAAQAERASAQTLEGTYVLVPAQSDDVNKAVDKGTEKLNFLVKPIARKRLRGTNKPYERVELARSGDQVAVTRDGGAPIVSPASGAAVKWKREDGEVFDLSTVWKAAELKQIFSAEDGSRENTFRLRPDGGVDLHVRITSGKLPAPIEYTLVYERARS